MRPSWVTTECRGLTGRHGARHLLQLTQFLWSLQFFPARFRGSERRTLWRRIPWALLLQPRALRARRKFLITLDPSLFAAVAAHPDFQSACLPIMSLQCQLQARRRGLAKSRLVALNNHVTTVWPERVCHLVRLVKGSLLKRLKTEMFNPIRVLRKGPTGPRWLLFNCLDHKARSPLAVLRKLALSGSQRGNLRMVMLALSCR